MNKHDNALIIFTKSPVPGLVKTRMIPALGEDGAAELYRSLVLQTLNTVRQIRSCHVFLYCRPDLDDDFLTVCATGFNLEMQLQQGSDLGERMYFALSSALKRFKKVIIIGCDCPELSASDLTSAFSKLEHGYEIVIGPAEDGGYYLIGASSAHKEIFEGISWGRETVLADTREKLKNLKLNWFELPERWDLDHPKDLQRYRDLMIYD